MFYIKSGTQMRSAFSVFFFFDYACKITYA